MGKGLEARRWIRILVLSGIVTALGRSAWAQGETLPPPLPTQAASAPSDRPNPASTTVEELAARLRAMEESNRKLAEQLERTNREHDEQMRLLLEKYGELSKRLNDGAKGAGNNGAVVGGAVPRRTTFNRRTPTPPCRTTPKDSSYRTLPRQDSRFPPNRPRRGCR